jgi:hypothetical protein
MMKRETLAIANIYVPVKRRATRDQKRVNEIAASILEKGQQMPILYGRMAVVSCWLKVYAGGKRPRRLVKRLFSFSRRRTKDFR